jgi:hypothetical protein
MPRLKSVLQGEAHRPGSILAFPAVASRNNHAVVANSERVRLRPVRGSDVQAFLELGLGFPPLSGSFAPRVDESCFRTDSWERFLFARPTLARTIEYGASVAGYVVYLSRLKHPTLACAVGRDFPYETVARSALSQAIISISARPLFARVSVGDMVARAAFESAGFHFIGTTCQDDDRAEDDAEAVLALM